MQPSTMTTPLTIRKLFLIPVHSSLTNPAPAARLSEGSDLELIFQPQSQSLRLRGLRRLQLARAADQFLQLAFNRRVPDMLILQHSIRVDGESLRNRAHGKQGRNPARKTAVAILQPSHLVFRHEVFPPLFVIV